MPIKLTNPRCTTCGEYTEDPRDSGFRAIGSDVFCGAACARNRHAKNRGHELAQRISSHYMRRLGVEGEEPQADFEKERAAIVAELRSLADEYESLPPVRPEREASRLTYVGGD